LPDIPFSFAVATFMMGVAGGPHCVAMCGGACAYIQQNQTKQFDYLIFQLGRICGYASLGAVAAYSVKSLAWVSEQTATLHPLWTFFHVLVLVWGLMLLLLARQPIWADKVGKGIWARLRQAAGPSKGVFLTGMLWVLMPCGLLYSALLVASLQANPVNGAISMATFAAGSSISLILAPQLWLKLKSGISWLTDATSMRLAGLLLTLVSATAIWMDLTHQVKIWCN
jgi:sulfite exporter TauE/SafE